jgi:type IV secretory pathway TrbD component
MLFFSSLYEFFFFQGWYIITYALGIYLLNLFIAFLTPQVDPAVMEDEGM